MSQCESSSLSGIEVDMNWIETNNINSEYVYIILYIEIRHTKNWTIHPVQQQPDRNQLKFRYFQQHGIIGSQNMAASIREAAKHRFSGMLSNLPCSMDNRDFLVSKIPIYLDK